ncbi:rhomboid family intramembrane serine protease [Winogradskyella forsetii]|uniref:rhomboid family intramembrane serine protease n=1 Tax=Winogradskyella forsetii TaxID=2686077 RepID=UPI0015C11246|nr:rhomboid family intramembrane serine protease [Winogradskyella forsetii]
MYNLDIVTIVVIAANTIISFKGFDDRLFFERYKFNVGNIRRGDQVRMISSGFLHADIKHLIFNMFTLFFFAHPVIDKLGNFNFVLIYFASLIFGNLLSLYFHKDEYWYSAIGASGAVTGVLYSAILLDPNLSINFIPGYLFGIGYLLFSIYGMKKRIGNIGHDAHFGGAIGGYVITLILMPSLFQTDLLYIGLLAIPIIILFVLHKTGKLN